MKKIVLAVALFAVTITVSAQDQTVNGNLSVSGNAYVSKTLEIKGQPYMGSLKSEIIHSGSLHIRTAENSSSSAIIDLLPGLLDTTQVARINFYKATSLKSYKKTAMINSIGSSFFNGGNVGIGTETPQNKLHVIGTIQPSDGIRIGTIGDGGNLNVPVGGVAKQYNIDFTGYRDIAPNQIGARISAIRTNKYQENKALMQKTALAFYTNLSGYESGDIELIERMRISPEGNIGIGTINPQYKLDVNGATHIFNTANAGHLILSANDNSSLDQTQIGIDFKIADRNQVISRIASFYDSSVNGGYGGLRFYYKNAGTLSEAMRIGNNGNVGIGTDKPDQKLTVKGKIHAQEVLIDLSGPLADYVFKPDYKLMPLNELEQFVQTNSHLPEIPSAEEVAEKGLSIGEMQNKLLQKIEELTLYVIDQNKKMEQQNKEIELLKGLLSK